MDNAKRLSATLASLAVAVAGIALIAAPSAKGARTTTPGCLTQQLHLAGHLLGEAGGQFTVTFRFTNASKRTCHLTGWPNVSLRSASGKPEPLRTQRVLQIPSLASVHLVTLSPNGSASFDVYGGDFNPVKDKPCARETSVILVTPPGDRSALRTIVHAPNCGLFLISPIISGSVDRQAWSIRA
jgi:hypothetical protein